MTELLTPCPHCWLKYDLATPGRESGRRFLRPEQAMNPLSRREKVYICHDCARAESLADACMPNSRGDETDAMFRTCVYADRCEGRRLPPGIPWGPSGLITTGSALPDYSDPYEDACPSCGSLMAYGFLCTECNTIRPALEMLKDHPILVERNAHAEQQVKAAAKRRAEAERKAKIDSEVARYVGVPRVIPECVNCGKPSLQRRDDYICLRCRASEELAGNPLLQHVLQKLDKLRGR